VILNRDIVEACALSSACAVGDAVHVAGGRREEDAELDGIHLSSFAVRKALCLTTERSRTSLIVSEDPLLVSSADSLEEWLGTAA
jgi:hypothetical protein